MDLAQEIKQFYFEHSADLSDAKRFHLASRLAAWEGTEESVSILQDMKCYLLPAATETVLSDILKEQPGKIYAKLLRQPYFDKYPKLFGLHNAFFRIRHLKEIYGLDTRDNLLQLIGQSELKSLYNDLVNDREAIRMLSRFAVDYIYLYEILYNTKERMNPLSILSEKNHYNLKDTTQLHLFIYLYTHCIIADSNFYIQKVPNDRLATYHQMLEEVEDVIMKHADIRMDNKFEFLVASRICGRQASLADKIHDEASSSISQQGKFIIDKLTGSLDGGLNTFGGSEHRNVLFIMSTSPFAPHSTLVS